MPIPAPVSHKTGSEVNHTDPWKEGGNIVLTAEGKHFRVQRCTLSADSDNCPRRNEAETEFMELCPHDAAADVQIVLKAMPRYGRSYPQPCYERMPIFIVPASLHLGEKYAFPALIKEEKGNACRAVEPTSSITTSFLKPPFAPTRKLFPAIIGSDPRNFQVINLLLEMGFKPPLPIAMYQCIITCPLGDFIDGYRDEDSFHALSPTELRSFIRMKDLIEEIRATLAKGLCALPSCNLSTCKRLRRLWSEDQLCTAF